MSVLRKSRSKTPQKQDRAALKNIVDPFLSWHKSLFDSCVEDMKKFPDYSTLVEDSLCSDGSFEVNEDTLYNILSADIQGNSKIESSSSVQVLPAIPACIAKRIKKPENSQSPHSEDSFESDFLGEKCFSWKGDDATGSNQKKFSFSDDFVDTEDVCKDLKHLKIMEEFMNNSDEYTEFKRTTKN